MALPMRIAAIVQARMSSRRLPGKVLRRVAGKPLLGYLVERLRRCRPLDGVTLATSTSPDDDAVARFCEAEAVPCHRGPLDDVAGRFLGALEQTRADAFVRVNGDSPLLDPRLIDVAVTRFRGGDADVVTNVLRRTYPPGQSVEVVRGYAFRRAYRLMTEPADFEHVTRVFYRLPDRFRLVGFESPTDRSGVRLAVDTPDDLAAFAAIVARMSRPHHEYSLEEILELHHAVAPEGRAA
jgi:spore coat polysaccharide biosynthesis protein SpsF